jgi:hypothetical protein
LGRQGFWTTEEMTDDKEDAHDNEGGADQGGVPKAY